MPEGCGEEGCVPMERKGACPWRGRVRRVFGGGRNRKEGRRRRGREELAFIFVWRGDAAGKVGNEGRNEGRDGESQFCTLADLAHGQRPATSVLPSSAHPPFRSPPSWYTQLQVPGAAEARNLPSVPRMPEIPKDFAGRGTGIAAAAAAARLAASKGGITSASGGGLPGSGAIPSTPSSLPLTGTETMPAPAASAGLMVRNPDLDAPEVTEALQMYRRLFPEPRPMLAPPLPPTTDAAPTYPATSSGTARAGTPVVPSGFEVGDAATAVERVLSDRREVVAPLSSLSRRDAVEVPYPDADGSEGGSDREEVIRGGGGDSDLDDDPRGGGGDVSNGEGPPPMASGRPMPAANAPSSGWAPGSPMGLQQQGSARRQVAGAAAAAAAPVASSPGLKPRLGVSARAAAAGGSALRSRPVTVAAPTAMAPAPAASLAAGKGAAAAAGGGQAPQRPLSAGSRGGPKARMQQQQQ